jgi:hypothetical protein
MRLTNTKATFRRILAGSATIAGLGTLSLVVAGPANASVQSTSTATVTSFGAYYLTTPSGGVASASTTFHVPYLNCSSGTTSGQAYGVEADFSNSWDSGVVAWSKVDALCNGTTPQYQFDVQANATEFIENGVSAGDLVTTSFFETSSVVQAIVHDMTSGYTWIADGNPEAATEVLVGATIFPSAVIGGYTHFAPATVASFTKTQVNGDYIGFQSPSQYNYHLKGWPVEAKTGKLSYGGDAFKLSTVVV